MEKRFDRSIASLDAICDFTREFFDGERIDEPDRHAVDFAIEEIFTNMVKYHPEGGDEIRIGLERDDDVVRVMLIDDDVEPFDVTRVPAADVDLPLERRTPGGLGLHLTGKMMDSMEYDYEDRRSMVLMTRRLGRGDA